MSEANITRRILRDCGIGDVRLFRNNVGRLRDRFGNFIQYGVCNPGGSDLIGWRSVVVTPDMVGTRIARFMAIEVKGPRGAPSDHQQAFLDAVDRAGGLAMVARSVEDVAGAVGT